MPSRSKRTGPADISVVRLPSLFAQVVEVSVRSDSASTRLPDSRAATFADARSAALVAASGLAGFCCGAAAAGPCSRVTDTAAARPPAVQRRYLLRSCQTVLLRAPAPKPDPDRAGSFLSNGAAAKAGLNKSVNDAGWGVFLTILHAKAESAGREVIAVDPRNTSRTCPQCGHVAKENRPTQEKFHCVSCGHTAHADTVGALNVLRAGLVRRNADPA